MAGHAKEYPGNSAIPEPGSDYYVFAGEIGWSDKYAKWLRRKDGRAKPQLNEAFDHTEHRQILKAYGELTRSERAQLSIPDFTVVFAGDDRPATPSAKHSASQIVKLDSWERIPGVVVELPSWGFEWESYHSEENVGGHPDYLAPSLLDYLGLRKRGGAVDLVEPTTGRLATLYREFGMRADGFQCHFLYLRADLLRKYLTRVGRVLVWINWGERSLHYSAIEQLRENVAMRSVWDSHAHIHKQFVIMDQKVVPAR